jgi:hypothetical protein
MLGVRSKLPSALSESTRHPLVCIIPDHLTAGPRRTVCKGIARYVPSFPVTHRAAALRPSLDPPPPDCYCRGEGRGEVECRRLYPT